MDKMKWLKRIVVTAIVFIIVLSFLFGAFSIIDSGNRGVIISKLSGTNLDRVMGEGFNFKLPFLERVEHWPIQTQKFQVVAAGSSSDLQEVSIGVTLNYKLMPSKLPNLRQEIGIDYQGVIMEPLVMQTVKGVIAQYRAEELIVNRAAVRSSVAEKFKQELPKSYIIFVELSLTNFTFSDVFNGAIEAKVAASQRALEAEQKKKQQITEAEAERAQRNERAEAALYEKTKEAEAVLVMASKQAEANNKISESLTPELLQMKWLERWDGMLPQYMAGETGGIIPMLNVSK